MSDFSSSISICHFSVLLEIIEQSLNHSRNLHLENKRSAVTINITMVPPQLFTVGNFVFYKTLREYKRITQISERFRNCNKPFS